MQYQQYMLDIGLTSVNFPIQVIMAIRPDAHAFFSSVKQGFTFSGLHLLKSVHHTGFFFPPSHADVSWYLLSMNQRKESVSLYGISLFILEMNFYPVVLTRFAETISK